MGSRTLLLVKDVKYTSGHCMPILQSILLVKDVYFTTQNKFLSNNEFLKVLHHYPNNICFPRNCSTTTTSGSSMESLGVPRLAETARISLTPQEVEEFSPKVGQVMEWFGQLQAVDLESLEPSIKEDTEGDNFRADITETFENREAIIAAIPNYEEPYIKVPKVLNKE